MTDDDHRSERWTHDEPVPAATDETADAGDVERARADELRRIVLHKSVRRARARQRGRENVWSWMGMFGLVGWTVAIPTLLGLAFGVFLDGRVDSSVSFTITFLVVGAAIGASMAWYWIKRESEGGDEP